MNNQELVRQVVDSAKEFAQRLGPVSTDKPLSLAGFLLGVLHQKYHQQLGMADLIVVRDNVLQQAASGLLAPHKLPTDVLPFDIYTKSYGEFANILGQTAYNPELDDGSLSPVSHRLGNRIVELDL